MSRGANLSALGLYEWDKTLFDLMLIPSGMDKDTLVNNLLAETAELEVLYPNPTVLKNLIGVWSKKQIDVWNKLYATTQFEYNPIENYDRKETGTNSGAGSVTHSGTDRSSDTTVHGGTDTRSASLTRGGKDTTTNTHKVAGFDSTASSLVTQSEDKNEVQYASNNQESASIVHGETITSNGSVTHGEKVINDNQSTHELRAHGNIGVTTTQEMIEQERRVDTFNLYDIIIENFKMRFCIMIY